MCLIHASPQKVSLRAVTHVDMLVLSKEDLDAVLVHDESVAAQVNEVAERLYPNPSKTKWTVYIRKRHVTLKLTFRISSIFCKYLSGHSIIQWYSFLKHIYQYNTWISFFFMNSLVFLWYQSRSLVSFLDHLFMNKEYFLNNFFRKSFFLITYLHDCRPSEERALDGDPHPLPQVSVLPCIF